MTKKIEQSESEKHKLMGEIVKGVGALLDKVDRGVGKIEESLGKQQECRQQKKDDKS